MFFLEEFSSKSNAVMMKAMSAVFDSLPYLIAVTDGEGQMLFFNETYKEAYKKLGIPLELFQKMSARELVEGGHIKTSGILMVLENKAPVAQSIMVGEDWQLYSYSTPISSETGEIIMAVNCSQPKEALSLFIEQIEKRIAEEQELSSNYQAALQYLNQKKAYSFDIIVKNPMMRNIYDQALLVANTDCSVLLYGESGTGKDVLAKYIHSCSKARSSYPFIPVNCAAIPAELMESEFFGYEKGAFTGANTKGKPGFFEMANNGTLFLNEIGELPLGLQSKLLLAVENGKISRLGSTEQRQTNVRLIAATNRNLGGMVKNGTFREDLFYRLNVVPIHIPPLRERTEEIQDIAELFLREYNLKYTMNRYFSETTLEALKHYDYPGNIRELKNIVERLAVTAHSDEIRLNMVHVDTMTSSETIGDAFKTMNLQSVPQAPLKEIMQEIEQKLIQSAIKNCNGNVTMAARQLGVHRSFIYKKQKVGK